ncbi:unannotated protein [freshwater metagenome]|uniref:Unannotated protein n=1 Tax=freshwater metagenome TaxID=449393 RepID=A0A6J6ERY4_9ZZZZ
MRSIIFVIDDSSGSASGDEMTAIDAFNSALQGDGHWVMAAGIAAPGQAEVIDGREGRESSSSGSLFDGAEYFSGFWIVETDDLETARRLAVAGSRACNRKVELRPFLR